MIQDFSLVVGNILLLIFMKGNSIPLSVFSLTIEPTLILQRHGMSMSSKCYFQKCIFRNISFNSINQKVDKPDTLQSKT